MSAPDRPAIGNTNWAGNHVYPSVPVRPTSEGELEALLADAAWVGSEVRAVGSGHSFNAIADAEVMIDLRHMPEIFEVEGDTVRVNAAMTYGRLAELLEPKKLALHNLASLPHISIAGSISTGTHGSGSKNGNLSTAVISTRRAGATAMSNEKVGLGATGVIVEVTLRVEPAYEVEQRVFEDLPWTAIETSFDQIFDSAYSVSAFTRWNGAAVEQVWVKRRTDEPDDSERLVAMGAVAAVDKRHPIPEQSPEACTEQLGVPGQWSERLPHFKLDFAPSVGDEIQSEYFIDRRHAASAIRALRRIGDDLAGALLISEIRTIAADDISMSPCFGRDSVAFHFTWTPGQAQAEAASAMVLAALMPFDPRPHWGKVFPTIPNLADRYPNYDQFIAQVDDRFVNDWFRSNLDPNSGFS